jgi:hypothetical protein
MAKGVCASASIPFTAPAAHLRDIRGKPYRSLGACEQAFEVAT